MKRVDLLSSLSYRHSRGLKLRLTIGTTFMITELIERKVILVGKVKLMKHASVTLSGNMRVEQSQLIDRRIQTILLSIS